MLLSDYDYCSSTSWGEERVIKVSWNCDPQVEVSVLLTLKTYVAYHTEQRIPVFVCVHIYKLTFFKFISFI
jgi:hypothetical protein